MSQASLFFRVFDLAFFAPGLVVLLPIWLVVRSIEGANTLNVSGVMAVGAWILMAYAVGLTVHGLGRLLSSIEGYLQARAIGRPAIETPDGADPARAVEPAAETPAGAPAAPEAAAGAASAGAASASVERPPILMIVLGILALVAVVGTGLGLVPSTPAGALLVSGATVLVGRQLGRFLNQSQDATETLRRSMTTPFDRDKQQELSLYFWYLRATCMNVAVAIPISLATWLGTAGTLQSACVAASATLPGQAPVLYGFNSTVHLGPGGVVIASIVAFVLAVSGGEYHRAWKQARSALVDSKQAALDQAIALAEAGKK